MARGQLKLLHVPAVSQPLTSHEHAPLQLIAPHALVPEQLMMHGSPDAQLMLPHADAPSHSTTHFVPAGQVTLLWPPPVTWQVGGVVPVSHESHAALHGESMQ